MFAAILIILQAFATSVLDPVPDQIRINPDSTLTWIPSKNPNAGLYHSECIPREYYLYIRPGARIQLDVSGLDFDQRESIRQEINRLSSYWDVNDGYTSKPFLKHKFKSGDHMMHLNAFDRVLIVRKAKTASQSVGCVLEYETEGQYQKDSLVLQGSARYSFPGDRMAKVRAITFYEPDLYRHPMTVSDFSMDGRPLSPVFLSSGRTIDADYPFVKTEIRLDFAKAKRIWKDTDLSLRYSVLDENGILAGEDVSLTLLGPNGWTRTIPVWLIWTVLGCLAASVIGVIILSLRKKDGRKSEKMLIRANEELQIRNSQLSRQLESAKTDAEARWKEKEGFLKRKLMALEQELLAANNENVRLQSELSQPKPEVKVEPKESFDITGFIALMNDCFQFQKTQPAKMLGPLLVPLYRSWGKLASDLTAGNGLYDIDSGQKILIKYLDDSISCLNTVVRLHVYMQDEGVSAFLINNGLAYETVWWLFRMCVYLLDRHSITLKDPPSLYRDLFDDQRYDRASGIPMLSHVKSADVSSLRNRSITDIGSAGYSVEGANDTNYSVYYYSSPVV